MDMFTALTHFGALDLIGAAYAILAAFVLGWIIDWPGLSRPSVSVLMMRYRHEWMHEFVTRDPRIFDSTVLDGLRNGITFYASACIIALGSGLALLGNVAPLQGLAADLPIEAAPVAALKVKLLLALGFIAHAFLKFVWSHRLFGYCSIMLAAVPNDPNHPECYPRTTQAAEVNINAARNYNKGLRSVYFALGSLGWLLGAEALIVTTTITVLTLLRGEFASRSRSAMLR